MGLLVILTVNVTKILLLNIFWIVVVNGIFVPFLKYEKSENIFSSILASVLNLK